MQDPGGDGKIVYLFLPLYKVKMIVSVRCFPMPTLPWLGVQRTVLVALEYIITRSSSTQINLITILCVAMSGLVSTHFSVDPVHDYKARLVEQFMINHLFRYTGYYQATQSTRPLFFSHDHNR